MTAEPTLQLLELRDDLPASSLIKLIDDAFLNHGVDSLRLVASDATWATLLASRRYSVTADRLTRSSWNRSTPFRLCLGDLTIRSVEDHEFPDFIALLQDQAIARMLVNLDHPIDDNAALRWIQKRKFTGRPGFQLGVFHLDQLVGSIGISSISHALVYFLGHEARGKGYSKTFIGPFVKHSMARWCLCRIFAGVFCDNPASRHILSASGFVVTGESVIQSPARSHPARFWEMMYQPAD